MKVLFVSSGRAGGPGQVVVNQGESLKRAGIEIDYLTIEPGLKGYLKGISKIRGKYKQGNFDLVHAHYSLSGMIASFTCNKVLVVSLMGSDTLMPGIMRIATRFFSHFVWKTIIVKTAEMRAVLKIKKVVVIPNGVDLERFKPMSKDECRKYLGFDFSAGNKLVISVSSPDRPEKNIMLAYDSVSAIRNPAVELKHLSGVPNEEMPYYMNAADVMLLTSSREGSVNVIKEAMACNIPVVSTDVGDVRWILGDTEGCYITSFDVSDISRKIEMALSFNRNTAGRERLINIGLDEKLIANRLIEVYREALRQGQ